MRRRDVLFLVAGALIAFVVIHDLRAPAGRGLAARTAIAAIDEYKAHLSPGIQRAGVRCRFRPGCSTYARAVLKKHGFAIGSAKTAWRLARCGPWTKAGTVDLP
jgi:putative component of membrane protein insertase Oxa1/YidC/SpoIIIJ protein YidD